MKIHLAAASLIALGSFALVSANGQERPAVKLDQAVAPVVVAPARAAPNPAQRVRLAFTLRSFDPSQGARPHSAGELRAAAAKPAPVADRIEDKTVAPVAAPAKRAWFAMDQSLRRGDIVVRDGDALVYEGERNGKRHFRTVAMSRLVSKDERERILESVRR